MPCLSQCASMHVLLMQIPVCSLLQSLEVQGHSFLLSCVLAGR